MPKRSRLSTLAAASSASTSTAAVTSRDGIVTVRARASNTPTIGLNAHMSSHDHSSSTAIRQSPSAQQSRATMRAQPTANPPQPPTSNASRRPPARRPAHSRRRTPHSFQDTAGVLTDAMAAGVQTTAQHADDPLDGVISDARHQSMRALQARQRELFNAARSRSTRSSNPSSSSIQVVDRISARRTAVQFRQIPPGPVENRLLNMVTSMERVERSLQVLMQQRVAERAAGSSKDAEQSDTGGECPICFDRLEIPSSVVSQCGHVFHMQCIMQHIEQRSSRAQCPICRRAMHRAELVAIMNGLPEKKDEADVKRFTETVSVEKEDEVMDLTGEDADAERNLRTLDKSIVHVLAEVKKTTGEVDVLKHVERELQEKMRKVEDDAQIAKEEAAAEKKELLKSVEREKREAVKSKLKLKDERDAVSVRLLELNEEISTYKKKRDDLGLETKKVEGLQLELAERIAKLNEERLSVKRQEERLKNLMRQKKEIGGTERREEASDTDILRNELKALRARLRLLKSGRKDSKMDQYELGALVDDGGNESSEDDVVKCANAFYEERKNKARRVEVEDGGGICLFDSGTLQKPSSMNRPVAPRNLRMAASKRGGSGAGLAGFVKERTGVQRPSKKIGSVAGVGASTQKTLVWGNNGKKVGK